MSSAYGSLAPDSRWEDDELRREEGRDAAEQRMLLGDGETDEDAVVSVRRPVPLPARLRLPAHVLEEYERDLHDERMAEHAATQEGEPE